MPQSIPNMAQMLTLIGDVIPFRRQSIEPGMGLTEGAGRMGGNTGGGGLSRTPTPENVTPEAKRTIDFLNSDAGKYWWALQRQQGFKGPGWETR